MIFLAITITQNRVTFKSLIFQALFHAKSLLRGKPEAGLSLKERNILKKAMGFSADDLKAQVECKLGGFGNVTDNADRMQDIIEVLLILIDF